MEQRTAAWFDARLGKVTASKVYCVVNRTAKGLPSAAYEDYKIQLLTERLTGKAIETYVTAAMQWGIDHEYDALEDYSFMTGHEVSACGFISHPSIAMAGASPDGLVGDDGLIEIKCPHSTTHARFLIDGVIKPEWQAQMQFQLACTGRQWVDFISFDPRFSERNASLRSEIKRLWRDEARIQEIEACVHAFLEEVQALEDKLTAKSSAIG
ncbi:lambda exonuclease family protein [Bartonella sp. DGB2]|uniref:lambda exonuclease family protein n=1 Tax=Bartonella sp. DGB2 TaxID=3388426 RepID=UPI00398FCBAF